MWLQTGFGFIEQFVTTSNYNALANSCTRLLTAARIKSFQSAVYSLVVVW
jgi:hypothetical protein